MTFNIGLFKAAAANGLKQCKFAARVGEQYEKLKKQKPFGLYDC